ncbi:universal stress protein [Reichenbachiella ulvae]|uniref:Universal stress protein n=1 Tax=Reichenbachiella ulvae TaxID=2980104 RepID=A0ABT3CV85_9BACT|nr:universal stress protein [Reichenbachiella ulvae]MCV9387612.1 universal stress protein [Reichenbachiella ulvae]
MNTILVPTDFSPVAEHAFDLALQVANKEGGQIVLLHIIEHPSSSSVHYMGVVDADPMESIFIKKMIEQAEAKMADWLAKAEGKGPEVKWKIKLGNPYIEITEQITETKCDIVIMGTEGTEGMTQELTGSNAERVIRKSHVPVVTMKSKCDVDKINKIAVASGFKDATPDFIKHLMQLQKSLNAELHFVRVNSPGDFQSTKYDKKLMGQFVSDYGFENCSTHIYNDFSEEDGIVSFAEEIDADMIAMETHGRTGIMHLLIGSIAEDVVNHAKRPVWTLNVKRESSVKES